METMGTPPSSLALGQPGQSASLAAPNCPLCLRNKGRLFRTGIRESPQEPVWKCDGCGLVYLTAKVDDLRTYYREEYRRTHNQTPGKESTALERFTFQQRFSHKTAKDFRELVPTGASVLEIGCSAGGFLSHLQHTQACPAQAGKTCACKKDDYDLYACEWNPEDAQFVREIGEIPCEEGLVPEVFPGRKFTAIVAISVLEHQRDPAQFIRECRDRLIGGGYLYMEVPNLRDALLSFYDSKPYADFYFRQPHLTYWTAEVLGALVATMGFEARLFLTQRYGLVDHVNWLTAAAPMTDAYKAREVWRPLANDHPAAPAFNRLTSRLDQEYRLQLENLHAADTIGVLGRRQEV